MVTSLLYPTGQYTVIQMAMMEEKPIKKQGKYA